MERVALFFLSRFGDNSVTIDGDLKQKLVRFDKIFFLFFFENIISESGDDFTHFLFGQKIRENSVFVFRENIS